MVDMSENELGPLQKKKKKIKKKKKKKKEKKKKIAHQRISKMIHKHQKLGSIWNLARINRGSMFHRAHNNVEIWRFTQSVLVNNAIVSDSMKPFTKQLLKKRRQKF